MDWEQRRDWATAALSPTRLFGVTLTRRIPGPAGWPATTAAVLAASALLLAGCSSGSQAADSASADASASVAAAAQSAVSSKAEQAAAAAPGPYAVGRRTITVTDDARAGRSFPVDIWYPVDPAATGGAAPSEYSFLPGLGYTSKVSLADAPAAKGQFPVMIYSHGGGGFRWVATFFTEFMASKGYVVVSPDHPGSTALDQLSGASVDDQVNAFNRPPDITRTLDTVLAADANPADPLAGTIDESRIAVSGHSWGGFTSLAMVSGHTGPAGTTKPDPRVKAMVVMAPYSELLSDSELAQVKVPVLMISSTGDVTTPIKTNTERPASLIPGRPLVRVDIDGGVHNSFTDVCTLRDSVAANPNVPAAVTAALDKGAKEACAPDVLDANVIHQITNTYSAAFLATELQGSKDYATMLKCVAPPKDATCSLAP